MSDDASAKPPQPRHGLPFWVAHTPAQPGGSWHHLPVHLKRVAELAAEFAEPFGGDALARFVGLRHDLGKFSDAFQDYLWACYQASLNHTKPPRPGSAKHKGAGTLAARDGFTPERLAGAVAAIIYGHHGGMPCPSVAISDASQELPGDRWRELARRAAAVDPALDCTAPGWAQVSAFHRIRKDHADFDFEMLLRLVFSCLTDADGLDTEAHMNPERAALPGRTASLESLRDALLEDQKRLLAEARGTPVNRVRREVYEACLEAAALPPGVFTLTVPTGGGKTRSSLAFALAHAVAHGQRRVIYALPYTSIVDQTVRVFEGIFGEDAPILEHHSAIDVRDEQQRAAGGAEQDGGMEELWRRLASENWDAPLIVTTTVQFFESLFSNRPGRCRKLHRIAGSVVVLDEVQTLPPHLLQALLSGLRTLTGTLGATVVLCTATQPALQGQSSYLKGFEPAPTPIIADPASHFAALRRVSYQLDPGSWSWEDAAAFMRQQNRSCMAVLNTKKDALALLAAVGKGPGVLHLSTLLCGRHRRKVLKKVAEALEAERAGHGDPVLLVSTQVVEAGVDLDFPVVLRAMGPMDRIIQVAGRCNREGRRPLEESLVVVFSPADGGTPKGTYETAIKVTSNYLRELQGAGGAIDFDDPQLVTQYFSRLYSILGSEGLDKRQVQLDRGRLDFPEVAKKVRLIDDDTVPALALDYDRDEAEAIIAAARDAGKMSRRLWQRAQPLCVAIYRTEEERRPDLVEPVLPGDPDGLLIWRGKYDLVLGLADGVARDPADLMA